MYNLGLTYLLVILYWDEESFANYLYPSMNLRTCPWTSMIEVDFNPSPLALLIEIVINPSPLASNHLVDPLPFNMVEEMLCDTHALPFMVGKLRNNRDALPFMVGKSRHNREALPFMVEETGQVAYSNMGVESNHKQTSEVSYLLYWNAQSSWSETLNLKNGGFSTCLELSPELCKSDYTFSEYVDLKLHKIWLHLRSSPLLELYFRAFFTLLRLFDIISQRDIPSVKCQELGLKLRRNILRSHDFAALMKRIGGCSTILNFANYIVYLIIFHHVSALQYFKFSIKITKDWCIMILALSVVFFLELDLPGFKPTQSFNPHNDLVTKNEIFGGGSAGIFSADKLSEFAILV